MKHFLLLAYIAATFPLYGQAPIHFLITSDQQINISEPLFEDMITQTQNAFQGVLSKEIKNQQNKSKNIPLSRVAFTAAFEHTTENVRTEMPLFNLGGILMQRYGQKNNDLYFSLQKVQNTQLAPVSVQIALSNLKVSPQETSLDLTVTNPKSTTLALNKHFSIATGRLLDIYDGNGEVAWFFYWTNFYEQTQLLDWLEDAIQKANPGVISLQQKYELQLRPIKESKLMSAKYLEQAKKDVSNILKDLEYPIPFENIQAILISQDRTKIEMLETNNEFETFDSEKYQHIQNWKFIKEEQQWKMYLTGDYVPMRTEQDTANLIINFYARAFEQTQTVLKLNEAVWLAYFEDELQTSPIVFKHVVSSTANQQLIAQHIQPKLDQLLEQPNYPFYFYNQRQNEQTNTNFWFGEEQIYLTADLLISNPEKTAFIYPVLLHHKKEQARDYYYTNEDFKFYVLLKNNDGTYTLHDWHYFKNLPYKSYYSLSNCVERHLNNISEYNAGQEIIDDTSFWNNYVFKAGARGYDYLLPVVDPNASIRISTAQFEAQVVDCIQLIQENDISTLYPNQLKQIIRCVNTIEKWNFKSTSAQKLLGLSNELKLQNRINKAQENVNGYYPQLDVEFKINVLPHAYYIVE